MIKKVKKGIHYALSPIRGFIADSRSVGIILVVCTVLSLVLSNLSSTHIGYIHFWQRETPIFLSFIHLPENVLLWINDVLMSIFFFLVGMEIKREITIGELASIQKSMMPVLAALGGMVCPAIIFSIFNGHTPYAHGWGIPMATDIAFSLGVLSLLGKRVPIQLKIFLAALAIIDDLGAVVTIAIFYTSQLKLYYLLGAAGVLGFIVFLNKMKVKHVRYYVIPGVLLWYCVFNSGIHATIAAVIMSFIIPLEKLSGLETKLSFPVNYFIMPLFALANTAIILPAAFGNVFTSSISTGVIFGLFIGKPVGIFLFSFIAIKLRLAVLPSRTTYKQLLGVGMLGGIGFTMSIFTSTLAYSSSSLQVISKVSIIAGSLISSVAGYVYLFGLSKVAKPVAKKVEFEFGKGEYEPAYASSAI